jgi:hypothetical protein
VQGRHGTVFPVCWRRMTAASDAPPTRLRCASDTPPMRLRYASDTPPIRSTRSRYAVLAPPRRRVYKVATLRLQYAVQGRDKQGKRKRRGCLPGPCRGTRSCVWSLTAEAVSLGRGGLFRPRRSLWVEAVSLSRAPPAGLRPRPRRRVEALVLRSGVHTACVHSSVAERRRMGPRPLLSGWRSGKLTRTPNDRLWHADRLVVP